MFSNLRIAGAIQAMLENIEAPPAPIHAIRERASQAPQPARTRRFFLPAAAAVAALVVIAPLVAPGFTQNIEAEIESILRWTPPPPPPKSVEAAIRATTGDLADAQRRVDFTIVPPAGLPSGAVREKIATTPTAVYSKITHSWSVGNPAVYFVYRRARGDTFSLLADRVDPRQGPPSKYVFLDQGRRNGHEVLERHENFAWRNGDQVMNAVAGEGLSAAEIRAIRAAMHGVPFPGVWPPQTGTIEKQYRLP
ncbi:MAG: hypothetical protein JOZ77_09940 [Candidatus Eremiobacteraeota bacterium]|nr:hypothetical protein [Candidatus Eremiobacteraeota bacterium]